MERFGGSEFLGRTTSCQVPLFTNTDQLDDVHPDIAVVGAFRLSVVARDSIYEFAGGEDAFLAVAAAHHKRFLNDPVLNHPFSHPGRPDHIQRLGRYWAEVFGGPPRYSESYGGHSGMLDIHAGMGADAHLGARFVSCFAQAADDAALPDDPAFRASLRAYMEWAVREVFSYSLLGSKVPSGALMPHWSWSGLE